MEEREPKPLLARATIHLPDFKAGDVYWVDENSKYVKECLRRRYLVAVDQEKT